MNVKDVMNEMALPVTGKTKTGKKLLNYRGIQVIILGESAPPDVHGIPKEYEAYGRGWLSTRGIQIDGGPNGSKQGHPASAKQGFYWGADYDAVKTIGQEKKKGVMWLRGRAGTDESWIRKNVTPILELIFKRLPRP